MKAQTVEVKCSTGRILCCTIFKPGGKKLLGKGHLISDEDVKVLESEGLDHIWVTQLEDGEMGEDEAVCAVSAEMGCGCYEVKLAAGGRANMIATEPCCVLVDDDLLKQVNCTSSVVIATVMNYSYAVPGQRIATLKSTPFAVGKPCVDGLLDMLRERGPIMQARPIRNASVGILYTDPGNGERAKQMFEGIMRQRLEHFGAQPALAVACREEEGAIARGLTQLLRSRPSVVLVASTTAPSGPQDAVGLGMVQIGAQLERFMAPVEPGNLLLLGYKDDIPILASPGCFRSTKANVVDLLLPPLLARYRVSTWEVACLGHGGLLA